MGVVKIAAPVGLLEHREILTTELLRTLLRSTHRAPGEYRSEL